MMSYQRRKNYSFLIIAVGVFSAFSCTQEKANTVKIGALLALTGSGANYGKSLRQGIEIAREEINERGGINGRKLEVIYEDSQGDPKTGVSGFNKLVTVDQVPLVVGSISGVVLAVAPIADEKGVVLLNSSAVSPKICEKANNFLFSVITDGAAEARFMAEAFVKVHKTEPIAVLFSNNASGIDMKENFIKQLTSAGGKLATAEGYELNATDFRTQLAKIRESGATFGYLIAFSSQEFAKIFIQSKEMGLDTQWFSYSGLETKETLDLARNAAEGVIYSYPSYGSKDTLMERFQAKYKERYGSLADIYTVTSYDGIKLLAQVLQRYGTTATQIQKGLREAGTYKGIFGELKFTEKQCVAKPLIWKTIRDGVYVLLDRLA